MSEAREKGKFTHRESVRDLHESASAKRRFWEQEALKKEAIPLLDQLYKLQDGEATGEASLNDILEQTISLIERGTGVVREDVKATEAAQPDAAFTEWFGSSDPYAAQLAAFNPKTAPKPDAKKLGSQRLAVDKSNAAEYCKKTTVFAHRCNAPALITKEWGESEGKPGDFVIIGPNDDVYMCEASLFESTYEPVPGQPHKFMKTGTIMARRMPADFMAETKSGVQRGKAGDYLVENEHGEQWSIDQATFEATYVEVTASHQNRFLENMLAPVPTTHTISYVPSKHKKKHYNGPENPEDVAKMLALATNWDFDLFQFQDATKGNALVRLLMYTIHTHDLASALDLDRDTLQNFAIDIQGNYLNVPYHTSVHAADVLHSTYHFVTETGLKNQLTVLEKFCLFVSAAAHDLGHPGTNNVFQIFAQTPFAIFYNDKNVLENFHAASMFHIMRRSGREILNALPRARAVEARKMMVDFILATDFAEHKVVLKQFDRMRRRGGSLDKMTVLRGRTPEPAQGGSVRIEGGSSVEGRGGSVVAFGTLPEDRHLICKITLKCADVGHPAKRWELHKKWTGLVTEEFLAQVEKEEKLGLPTTMRVSTVPHELAQSQVGFLKFMVQPLIRSYSEFHGQMRWLSQLKQNLATWERLAVPPGEGAEEAEGAGAGAGAGAGSDNEGSTVELRKSVESTKAE